MRNAARLLALAALAVGLCCTISENARASGQVRNAIALGADPSAFVGNHGDAVIAPDGSVLPQTGSTRSPGDPRKAAAEALFQEALDLTAEGRFSDACAKYEASEALDVGVGTLLHLADCYEQVGRFASAWAAFREAESLARVLGMNSRQEIAVARTRALEPKLSRLVIEVPPESKLKGLTIRLGESTIEEASWGAALPVDPGQYEILAEASGFEPARVRFDVAGDDPRRFRVVVPKLEPLPRAQPVSLVPTAPAERPESSLRTWGLVVGASGIVGLGAAGILAAVAAEKNEQSLDHCPSVSHLCSERGVELRDQAGTYADVATATAAVGGGLLISGIALVATAPSGQKENPKSAATLKVSPTFNGRGAGVRLGGSF